MLNTFRLQKDILTLRTDLQQQEQEQQSSLQDQLSEANAVYTQELEKLIDRTLSGSATNNSKDAMDRTAVTSTMVAGMKKDVQHAIERQTKSMEKNIQEMFGRQLQKQQQQLQKLHSTLLAEVSAGIESAAERGQDKENDELVQPLTVSVFEEKFEEYHSQLKHQLEEMHRKHVQEVERIQKEIKPQGSSRAQLAAARNAFTTSRFPQTASIQSWASGSGYFPKTTGYQLQCRKEMAMSPVSQLDRSSVFSKAKPPSPLPQDLSQSSSDPEITFRQQPHQPEDTGSKANQGKKRKKCYRHFGFRKKGSKKRAKSQSSGKNMNEAPLHKPQIQQKAVAPKSQKTADPMLVYNFSEEPSPDKTWWHFEK